MIALAFFYFFLLNFQSLAIVTQHDSNLTPNLYFPHPFHRKEIIDQKQQFTIPLLKSVLPPEKVAAALLKVKLRQQPKTSLLQTQDVPLTEEVLTDKRLATYYSTFNIGGSLFRVLLDTGSAEMWIPSDQCQTDRCHRHHLFPTSTSGFRLASQTPLDIEYLSGAVRGQLAYQDIIIGDVHVTNQVVGLANVVDIDLLDDVEWDGIVGFAYPNPQLTQAGALPFFDNIMHQQILKKQGLANQFAYYIDDTKGSLSFGGADCDLVVPKGTPEDECINKFGFTSVTKHSYWTIKLHDVHIQYPGKDKISGFCPEEGCEAIVDSGTYLIYGPDDQVHRMLDTISSCSDVNALPDITFEIPNADSTGPNLLLTIRPIDYVLEFAVNGGQDCVIGVSPDRDTIWTLGQVFLRSYYTVFDRDENRVGFARLSRQSLEPIVQPEMADQL